MRHSLPTPNRENSFRTIVENANEAIVIVQDKRIKYANPKTGEMTGYSFHETFGKPFYEFIHPDDRERTLERYLKRMAGEAGSEVYEFRLIHKNGQTRWMEIRVTRISWRGKLATLNCLSDITERKETEAALKRSEDHLRSIIDSVADGILVVDREGRVTHSNTRFAEMWRIPEDLLATRDDRILLNYVLDQLEHPAEFLDRVECLYQSAEDDRDTILFRDGRVFERYSSPLFHDDEIVGRVWSFKDVTERTQAQRALEARAHQQAVVAQLGQYALSTDDWETLLKKAVRSVADTLEAEFCKVLQVRPEQNDFLLVAGVGWKDGLVGNASVPLGPDSQAGFTLLSRKPVIVRDLESEHRFRGPSLLMDLGVVSGMSVIIQGTTCPWGVLGVHATSHREFTEDDAHFLESVANVLAGAIARKNAESERLELESQMQHAQKLESLGILAGGIAHDFNNILHAILGNTSLALEDLPQNSPVRPYLEEVEKASKRASILTRQMLAYSGKGHFVVEPVDLNFIVKEMMPLVKSSISKKVILETNLDDHLPMIEADAAQIQQVVMNLITNAAEALEEDQPGHVRISTGVIDSGRENLPEAQSLFQEEGSSKKNNRYVYLEVQDDGCGMDEETRNKIFDPFFTTKFTGRGLGLAAVQGIVRGHNGMIHLTTSPGRGTCFKVFFPAGSKEVPRAPQTETHPGERPGAGGTILIVDDEPFVRQLGNQVLSRVGFDVLEASTGEEAIRVFRSLSSEIVCVLLDLTMPGIGGRKVCEEIHKINPRVPVILTSGYEKEEATLEFAGLRLAGFIQKPYRPDQLKEKILGILGDRSAPS